MVKRSGKRRVPAGGFLSRLAGDRRGNTLAMMAAFLIPLSALAGSAVDVGRLYVVKVRLQQACDAGVLAGRKFMTDSNAATLDATATTQAQNFFGNNFKVGWMGTTTAAFTPLKTADGQVSGTASVIVPMTVMKMFAMPATTISVACQARYDVADTDVMFVLDTTGSMACLPTDSDSACSSYVGAAGNSSYTRPSGGGGVTGYAGGTAYSVPERSGSRIEALRQGVLSFVDTFAANKDPLTNVRYGFVTYTSSVNAGQAILDKSASYLFGANGSSDTATYQSRHVIDDYVISTSDTRNDKTQANCTAAAVRTPSAALTYTPSSGTATSVYDVWRTQGASNSNSYFCYTRTDTLGPKWEYPKGGWPIDVSQLVAGNTVTDPTKVNGSTMKWLGCVETTVDTPGQTSFNTTSLPSELDPDLKPTGAQRWWPQMAELEYMRNNNSTTNDATDTSKGDDGTNINYADPSRMKSGYIACGKPVKRLGVMTRSDVYNYLYASDFVPIGGTYHDTGMIWGSRLISPSGAWANDTAAWPGRNTPNRVIVFMTDGDMAPNAGSYSMYGVEAYDHRVLGTAAQSNLTNYHNYRFLAACAAAKARNIDIWTVSIDSSASTQMQTCATTSNQALYTTTGSGLSAAFTSIAQHLAMLRITK
jgi:Flp pilus assembly protein TadG